MLVAFSENGTRGVSSIYLYLVPISVPCAFRVCVWVGATEVDLSANPASLRLAQTGEDWCDGRLGFACFVFFTVWDYSFLGFTLLELFIRHLVKE